MVVNKHARSAADYSSCRGELMSQKSGNFDSNRRLAEIENTIQNHAQKLLEETPKYW